MQELNDLISDQLFVLIGGLAVLVLWLLIWNFVQGAKLRKMRRKYEMMMKGTGVEDLESLLVNLKVQLDEVEDEHEKQQRQLQQLEAIIPKQKAKIGIKRYNAYAETGSDLSFSIAIINEMKDGVVLTGLFNREGSYVYAKPLKQGESTYSLSPEEREAIILAGQEG
ncbi:DUF4446 family protein [Paenibacillus physcomitrellae]|uniref:DUF4446 family protein n=1 Tax=Paenibacillus physcomitrellae TaxID=1619311 RepID=A0ABQ1GP39_9BACL|nr:DUF4446 family protein [Paenibacillus physcomitrellae]GGA47294.1 hypothetical protein GCM10010917_35730 [Paenibacillus physcomitrellae]